MFNTNIMDESLLAAKSMFVHEFIYFSGACNIERIKKAHLNQESKNNHNDVHKPNK